VRLRAPAVDLFLEPPMPFDHLWDRSVVVTMRGVPVRVVGLDDLIELKRRAARPEDLADGEALTEIRRLAEEQPRDDGHRLGIRRVAQAAPRSTRPRDGR